MVQAARNTPAQFSPVVLEILPQKAKDAATVSVGSDCYPYTILSISKTGHCMTLRADAYRRTDHNGTSDAQAYQFWSDPKGLVVKAYRHRNGRYLVKGHLPVSIGTRHAHWDPTF